MSNGKSRKRIKEPRNDGPSNEEMRHRVKWRLNK